MINILNEKLLEVFKFQQFGVNRKARSSTLYLHVLSSTIVFKVFLKMSYSNGQNPFKKLTKLGTKFFNTELYRSKLLFIDSTRNFIKNKYL